MGDMEQKRSKPSLVQLFIPIAIIVLIVQIIVGFFLYCNLGSWTERGQFGDMFGAVNTLFSGLAFAGVLVALWMQSKELSLQREELRLTRTEMEASRKAQEISAEQSESQVKITRLSAKIQAKSSILQVYSKREELVRMDHTGNSSRQYKNPEDLVNNTIRDLNNLLDEAG